MDESFDLKLRIKQFLTRQPQFRNPSFDPAPYLINILKQKQANSEGIIQKQNQLIQLENQCHDLVDDICAENFQDFLKFIGVPQIYAENLQKMKSNVSVVKKKVKQAKTLLMSTQKDIQQVHYNCMYNKIVYKKLKQIQVRLIQYETAYMALKNNQYLLCSFNLPNIEGNSILQSALASKAEALRLRMLTKAIDEINLFIFLIPKVVLPSMNAYFERIAGNQSDCIIGNWEQHENFYKRYKLFQKVQWKQYLMKIWNFQDLQRKQGKIGKIYDIIKAVINVGRLQEITSSVSMNGKKQINNLFILLKYFRIKDAECSEQNIPNRWFIDHCTYNKDSRQYITAILCIIAVLFRKNLVTQKIYDQFCYTNNQFHCGTAYNVVLAQIQNLIETLYFPGQSFPSQNGLNESAENAIQQNFITKLAKFQNYINYGYSGYVIRKSLKVIEQNLIRISEQIHGKDDNPCKIEGKGFQLFQKYHIKFYENFHKDFCESLKQIFSGDGRTFLVQSFESIIVRKQFNEDELKYLKTYRSDDKKSIKQYVFCISFLKALDQFFNKNHLQKEKLRKYVLMVIILFYLKLNYNLKHNLFNHNEYLLINQQRKTDKKLKKKQQQFANKFYKIAPLQQIEAQYQKNQSVQKVSDKGKNKAMVSLMNLITQSSTNQLQRQQSVSMQEILSDVLVYNLLDKFKTYQKQNQMIVSFSTHFFKDIQEEYKKSKGVIQYYEQITKLEPANYQENINAKITRIWDTLPNSQKSISEYTTAALHKIFKSACIINAKIFKDSGIY